MRQKRFGCSGIFAFLFLAGLAFVFYRWPFIVDAKGTEATASITEKRESVRENFGQWFRQFEIVAAFHPTGNPAVRHAACDVEQATYDHLHAGDAVTVHYFPALLQQPFIPATHLSPCTPAGNFGSNPRLYRTMKVVFGSLAAILFAWLVLRIRMAAWLLVPWFGFFVVYGVTPQAEPAPSQPRPAQATVRSIARVDEILGGQTGTRRGHEPIRLQHPYQLVQLEFTPAGSTDPVVALDAVDVDSVAHLAPKQTVDIDYDAANPRVARIRGGTRHFPTQALRQLTLMYGVMMGLVLAVFLFSRLVRRGTRGAWR